MKPTNNNKLSRGQSTLRICIIILAATVLVLELVFLFFGLNLRPLTPLSIYGITACAILFSTRPGIFTHGFSKDFRLIPISYKILLAIACYLLVIKAVFFLFYFVAALIDWLK